MSILLCWGCDLRWAGNEPILWSLRHLHYVYIWVYVICIATDRLLTNFVSGAPLLKMFAETRRKTMHWYARRPQLTRKYTHNFYNHLLQVWLFRLGKCTIVTARLYAVIVAFLLTAVSGYYVYQRPSFTLHEAPLTHHNLESNQIKATW